MAINTFFAIFPMIKFQLVCTYQSFLERPPLKCPGASALLPPFYVRLKRLSESASVSRPSVEHHARSVRPSAHLPAAPRLT